MLITHLIRVATGATYFISNGILSGNGASILVIICGIALFTIWFIRTNIDKRRENLQAERACQNEDE